MGIVWMVGPVAAVVEVLWLSRCISVIHDVNFTAQR